MTTLWQYKSELILSHSTTTPRSRDIFPLKPTKNTEEKTQNETKTFYFYFY